MVVGKRDLFPDPPTRSHQANIWSLHKNAIFKGGYVLGRVFGWKGYELRRDI